MSAERYTKVAKLGEGTYGIVYQAIDTTTQQIVAMKVTKFAEDDGIPVSTLREMSILKSLSHPNIISLRDVITEPGQITMVLDCMHTDLRRFIHMKKGKGIDPALLCSYAFQLVCGVFVLHTHRVMHRDLKPDNVLLDKEGLVKISDFGLSRYITLPIGQHSMNVVTLWYRAPELLFGSRYYDLSVDVWSLGLVIAEMVKGEVLFGGDSDIDQLNRIFRVLGTPSVERLPGIQELIDAKVAFEQSDGVPLGEYLGCDDVMLVDLIARMLTYDPKKRITAHEALQHPYFEKVNPRTREICYPVCQ